MEFHVPQFIDVEDKLFGQFTFSQAVYMVGGASIAYIVWQLVPDILFFVKVLLAGAAIALASLLAFYPKEKYGKPFIGLMESAFQFYFLKPRLYTWKRIPKKIKKQTQTKQKSTISVTVPNISDSNLKDMSWGLDVNQET